MKHTSHLDLIAKMLRKAEGTDNQHEKDAFFSRAQKLATRHSIDLAMARAHTAKAEKREVPEEQTILIGKAGQNGLAKYVKLFLAIASANDIKCLIQTDSTRVYALGFPSDIEVAEALYASLVLQMVKASDEYLATGEYKKETVYVPGRWKRTGTRDYYGYRDEVWVEGHNKPVHGKTARQNFYDGFIASISKRLWDAKMETEAAAVAEDVAKSASIVDEADANTLSISTANLPISTALVLTEKKNEVAEFYAARIKAQKIRGSWKGGSRSTATSSSARSAGRAAGQRASLGGSRSIGA